MNTILQKRIEEAAKQHSCYDEDCEGAFYEPIVRNAFIRGANFALQNQWISVEEALPPYDENGISKEVIVRTGFDTKRLDRYFANCKEWEYSHKNVTHWMEIPILKGGEE